MVRAFCYKNTLIFVRFDSRFLYKNGKRLFFSNDIDRAFSNKLKTFTFFDGKIRAFSKKTENGTVR